MYKKIILVGGFGKLGRVIAAECESRQIGYQQVGRNELAEPGVDIWFQQNNIDADCFVLNCAGLLGTEHCEHHRHDAIIDNYFLSDQLAKNCKAHGSSYVYISTEAVFGFNNINFVPNEDSMPAPNNWYGISKLLGENAALAQSGVVVRLPILVALDEPNSLFAKLLAKVRMGEQIECVEDCFSTPIYIKDAATSLVDLVSAKLSAATQIFHFGSNKLMSIFDIMVLLCAQQQLDSSLVIPKTVYVGREFLGLKNGGLQSKYLESLKFD